MALPTSRRSVRFNASQRFLEPLEQRTLLSAATGFLDLVETWPTGSALRAWGWAFDGDTGNAGADPVQVRLDIDGSPVTTQNATLERQDLAPIFGSTQHGFMFVVPPMAAGTHTLRIVAFDQPSGAEVVLGIRTLNVSAGAFGFADSLDTSSGISGWAFDPRGGGAPSQIRIDVDGNKGTVVSANLVRNDLTPLLGSANHGFALSFPTLSPGPHKINVVALGILGEETVLRSTAIISPGPPIGFLDAASPTLIGGWAMDPDVPSQPVQVRIDIDGSPFRTLSTDIQRGDLAQFGTGAFGFQFTTPTLNPGTHTVTLFALDVPSGTPFQLGQASFTTVGTGSRPPVGFLDAAGQSLIGGWAMDPDVPPQSIQVRIDVDGTPFRTVTTDMQRGDLAQFGPGAYGFQFGSPTFAAGSHTVTMFAIDVPSGNAVQLGQATFVASGSSLPLGWTDMISASQIAGWALDLDSPNQPVQVRIDIDGVTVATLAADRMRNDLTPIFNTTNHGFSYVPAPLAPGLHQVSIFASDLQSANLALIGSGTFTV